MNAPLREPARQRLELEDLREAGRDGGLSPRLRKRRVNLHADVYVSFVTVSEAAGRLGISEATIRHQIRNGRMRAHKIGRDWDIQPDELQRYRAESLGKPGRRAPQPTLGLTL